MEVTQSATTTTQIVVQEPESLLEPLPPLTQQEILQITLAGPYFVVTVGAILASIHFLRPVSSSILLGAAFVFWIIHNDYLNFISLGPGGTPSTVYGYLKVTYLRLFALSDPYSPAKVPGQLYPATGCYSQRSQSWLPSRNGPRPRIAGIAPQRQLNQPGSAAMYQTLRATIENLAARHPDSFRIGTSCFEKKGLALFSRDPINATCRGEICHVHHSDRSMHMNLHPDDAKIILEKGWGERHPLAKGGWMKAYVPQEFLMIYAPRDRSELDVVCRIIEAAGFWVCGERFSVETPTENLPERDAQPTGGLNC